ncbi:MAG: MtaA/CmuA family methyltransferase [Planctomycetota bacterium]
MTSKERLLNALLQKPVDRVPVAGLVTAINKAAMEHAGVTFRESLTSAEKYALLAAAPYELYGLESIKLPFGMTVEAEILGAEIDFGDDFRLPQVRKPPFSRPGEFKIPDNMSTRGRIPLVRKSVELLQKKYGRHVAVITSIVGPFTLAGMVFGLERLLIWMVTEHQTYQQCLDATTDFAIRYFAIRYCKIQEDMGTDVIQIGEASCSGDLISVEDYRKNILQYQREVCSTISVPSVIHICGNISRHFEFIPETNATGISFDDGNDMAVAVKYCKGKVALLGYVRPIEILQNGTPDKVQEKCLECIDNGVDVLHAGCAWPPDVPHENAMAFVNAVRN